MDIRHEHAIDSGYLHWDMAKPVNFYCAALSATSVSLVGDFNGWNPTAHLMERRVDGWRFIAVPLTHGHHQYCFLVDGEPALDPRAAGVAHKERNGEVSLMAVS